MLIYYITATTMPMIHPSYMTIVCLYCETTNTFSKVPQYDLSRQYSVTIECMTLREKV